MCVFDNKKKKEKDELKLNYLKEIYDLKTKISKLETSNQRLAAKQSSEVDNETLRMELNEKIAEHEAVKRRYEIQIADLNVKQFDFSFSFLFFIF